MDWLFIAGSGANVGSGAWDGTEIVGWLIVDTGLGECANNTQPPMKLVTLVVAIQMRMPFFNLITFYLLTDI